jgi:hypothetical protein
VSHVSQGGEVGGRILGTDAAFVIAKSHVHHPVQAVFNGPLVADHGSQLVRWQGRGRYIEARLPFEFVANFALALDYENAVQARPVVALLQPADIGRVENGENIAEVIMRARAVAKAAEPAQMLEFLLAELGDIGPECP